MIRLAALLAIVVMTGCTLAHQGAFDLESYGKPHVAASIPGAIASDGVDDSAAIQLALDQAYVAANPGSGNSTVRLGPGVYDLSQPLIVRDYQTLVGDGQFSTVLAGGMTGSYIRTQYGESPSLSERSSGISIKSLAIRPATLVAGSIGINLRNAQYSTVEDVSICNVDIGVCTDQVAQYNTFRSLAVQSANVGALLESVGGGNSLIACHIAGWNTAIDINGGTWDILGGTAEALSSSTAYCLRAGRNSGQDTVVTATGLYVEGTSSSTVPLHLADSVSRSAVYNLHRHSSLGPIVNQAPLGAVTVHERNSFDPQARVQRIAFSRDLNASGPDVTMRALFGSYLRVSNPSETANADMELRSVFMVGGGLSARTDGLAPNVLRGYIEISGSDTTGSVVFSTPQPFLSYFPQITCEDLGGAALGSSSGRITSKSVSGFTITINAAPGPGKTVVWNWILTG